MRSENTSRKKDTHRTALLSIRQRRLPLRKTFKLDERDSGKPLAPVTYTARPGEPVRLIGGAHRCKTIYSGRLQDIRKRFDAGVRDKILQIDLAGLGITQYGEHRQFGHGLPVVNAPLEFAIDHQIMTLARYPNHGGIAIGEVIDPGSVPRIGDYSDRGGIFLYTDDRHARWLKNEDIWLQGAFKYGFADDKIKVRSIDTLSRRITPTKRTSMASAAVKISTNTLHEPARRA